MYCTLQGLQGKKKGQKSNRNKKANKKNNNQRKNNKKNNFPLAQGNDLTAKLFATMEKHKEVSGNALPPSVRPRRVEILHFRRNLIKLRFILVSVNLGYKGRSELMDVS